MKKKYIIFSLLIFNSILFSQNKKCIDFIENNLIVKFKNYDSRYLIPYYSEKHNAWGYFDGKTNNKVLDPIFKSYNFFNPYIFINVKEDILNSKNEIQNCNFRLFGSSNNFKIEYPDTTYVTFVSLNANNEKLVIKESKGFEIDSNNKLIACNNKFFNKETNKYMLSNFFKIKDLNFAIFKNKDKYSIVDENGKFMKEFKNMLSEPKIIYFDTKDVLFFIHENENAYKVKSLYNTLICNEIFENEVYFTTSDVVGYQKISKDESSGIFDFIDFKWILKPNNKIYVDSFEYSSNIDFYEINSTNEKSKILNNRINADFYIITKDKKVYDLNLNELKPLDN